MAVILSSTCLHFPIVLGSKLIRGAPEVDLGQMAMFISPASIYQELHSSAISKKRAVFFYSVKVTEHVKLDEHLEE